MAIYRDVQGTLSGLITVTTAGTAVQGPTTSDDFAYAVKAHPDNSDTVWIGNVSDDVAATNGFPLNPGEGVVIPGNLSRYWFDADVNGEKLCWLMVAR